MGGEGVKRRRGVWGDRGGRREGGGMDGGGGGREGGGVEDGGMRGEGKGGGGGSGEVMGEIKRGCENYLHRIIHRKLKVCIASYIWFHNASDWF